MDMKVASPVEGQSPESRQAVLGALDAMKEMAESASAALDNGGAKVRTLDDKGNIVEGETRKPGDLPDAERQAILQKVGAFLDSAIQGPRFVAVARGKLFIGEYPRRQDLLDVQRLAGNLPGAIPTAGQLNLSVIEELRSALFGWIPAKSPKAQLLRANIDKTPAEWHKLGITINPVDWMASRDPFLFEGEIDPLWDEYLKWKEAVTPSRDEIDFYYSLMQ